MRKLFLFVLIIVNVSLQAQVYKISHKDTVTLPSQIYKISSDIVYASGDVGLSGYPNSLVATMVSATAINLTWTDGTTGEDGFIVERSSDYLNYTPVDTIADTTYFANTGLNQSTRYWYRVRGYKGNDTTRYSDTGTTTTIPVALATNTAVWVAYDDLTTITKTPLGKVTAWNDKGGGNHHLLQADTTKAPIHYNTGVWDLDGMKFDGSNDYIKANNFTLNQPEFVYFVFRGNSTSQLAGKAAYDGSVYNRGNIIKAAGGRNNFIAASAGTLSANSDKLEYFNWGITRALYNGANSKFIVNNTVPITGNFGANNLGSFTVGSGGAGDNRWASIIVKEAIVRTGTDTAEANIYKYLKNKYFWFVGINPADTIKLNAQIVSAGVDDAAFRIAGYQGATPIYVDWGDSVITYPRMNGVLDTMTHIYTRAGTYKITIGNASSLKEFNVLGIDDGEERVWANVSYWGAASRLERFAASNVGGAHQWIGNISVLPTSVTHWHIGYNTNFTGDMTKFVNTIWLTIVSHATSLSTVTGNTSGWTKVEWYFPFGQNSFYGAMDNCINLKNTFIGGLSENTMDVTNMLSLRSVEKGDNAGFPLDTSLSYIHGDLTNHYDIGKTTYYTWPTTGFKYGWICVNNPVGLYGDVSTLDSAVYLSMHDVTVGTPALYGSLNGLKRLYAFYIRNSQITGNIDSLPNLEALLGTSQLTKPTTVRNNPYLHTFSPGLWDFNVTEVNQILSDFWFNRDQPKPEHARSDRLIDLNTSGSAAPTGQGLIDKAALQNYRSPNNNAAEPLWEVLTK